MMSLCIECGKNLDENSFYNKVRKRCKDCLNKKFKCELCGKFFSEKWLTTHIEREHRNETNSSVLEKPKTDNVNTENNNRTLLVGCSFSGKTYFALKKLSRIPLERNIYIITKSPPEQYLNSKIKIEEISDEIKPLNECENAVIVFDDVLGSSNSKYKDQFFIRGRHNIIDIYNLSQSYFNLPKRTIRNNSNKIFLFNQILKVTENIYRDSGGNDLSYDEFKDLCRKKIIIIFVLIDPKRKIREDIVYIMKAKRLTLNALLERNRFKTYDSYSHNYCYMCNYKISIPSFIHIKEGIEL